MRSSEDTLRVVFMGTPEFALPQLEALAGSERVVAVVTNPDRPKGRGRRMQPSPVKRRALEAGLPVLQPRKLGSPPLLEELRRYEADVFVVAAYGRILPREVLQIPRLGCVNVHASLLPAYRGAAPIQWAVINGETRTGVTIMLMDEGMDTGPILLQTETDIRPDDTAGTLGVRLAEMGGPLLKETLVRLKQGRLTPTPQPEAPPSLAPMLTKEQGRIQWGRPAHRVSNLIRGADPWPTAYAYLDDKPMKVFRPVVRKETGPAGRVLGLDGDRLVVACAEGAVGLGELQLPGRKRMSARALCAGTPIPPGTTLG